MVPTFCLLACVIAPAQPPSAAVDLPGPRLLRGQELVYSGSFIEESTSKRVQSTRKYRVDSRVFVLEAGPHGLDIALFTVIKPSLAARRPAGEIVPIAVSLECGRVDPQGRLTLTSEDKLTVPLDGPATIEMGAFVEWPKKRVGAQESWETSEENRPPRFWHVAGSEAVNVARCLKLEGIQQSEDWEHPRADRAGWQRRDAVWVAPGLGIALRLERTIERREPARRETTTRSVVRLELESRVVYPGLLYSDREREIRLYQQIASMMTPILGTAGANGPWESMLMKIAYHVDNQPTTPYREALLHLRRRIEAARRGETAVMQARAEFPEAPSAAAAGQPAPDFLTTDLVTRESVRLRRLLGRPLILLFYNPASKTAADSLRLAQSFGDAHDEVRVLALAMSEDADRVLKQRKEMKLTLPVLSGVGVHVSYAVDATPKWVIIDADGVIRSTYVGWGQEIASLLHQELKPAAASSPDKKERIDTQGPGRN
jgi:peroxiredoxin